MVRQRNQKNSRTCNQKKRIMTRMLLVVADKVDLANMIAAQRREIEFTVQMMNDI